MRAEVVTLCRGDIELEIIAETDFEFAVLNKAWAIQGYKQCNGRSLTPKGESIGVYIPLFCTTATFDSNLSTLKQQLSESHRLIHNCLTVLPAGDFKDQVEAWLEESLNLDSDIQKGITDNG